MSQYTKKLMLFLGCCFALFSVSSYRLLHAASIEYVKASYLIYLSQFVYWPIDTKVTEICVVGSDNLGAQLREISSRSGLASSIKIQNKSWSSSFDSCNILYVSEVSEIKLPQILYKVSSSDILTVSSINNFVYQEGAIGFVEINGRIKIEINKSLLDKKGISINSELLEIARKVI